MKYSLVLILTFLGLYTFANDEKYLAEIDGTFRYAMEVEIPARALTNIVRFYNFGSLHPIRQELPESITNDYIINSPKAFENLPEELQKKLLGDIEQKDLKIDFASGKDGEKALPKEPSKIILSGAEKVETGEQAIITSSSNIDQPKSDSGIILGTSTSTPPRETKSKDVGLKVDSVGNWQVINRRWNALSKEEKLAAINWEDLGTHRQAKLIMELGDKVKLKRSFRNLPGVQSKGHAKKLRRLFDRLHFSEDGSSLEFRYKDNFIQKNPTDFLNDLYLLADMAGARKQLDEPEKTFRDVSYHFNVSKSDKKERFNVMDAKADIINDAWFARIVNRGDIQHASERDSAVTYDSRQYVARNEDRYEVRLHHDPPKEELIEVTQLLKLNKTELKKKVEPEIKKAMNIMIKNYDSLDSFGKLDLHGLIEKGWADDSHYKAFHKILKNKGKLTFINELVQLNDNEKMKPMLKSFLKLEGLTQTDLDKLITARENYGELPFKEYLKSLEDLPPNIPMETGEDLLKNIYSDAVYYTEDAIEPKTINFTQKVLKRDLSAGRVVSGEMQSLLLDPKVYNQESMKKYFAQVSLGNTDNTNNIIKLLQKIPEDERLNHPIAIAVRGNVKNTLRKTDFSNRKSYGKIVSNNGGILQAFNLVGGSVEFDTAAKVGIILDKSQSHHTMSTETREALIEILERSDGNARADQIDGIFKKIEITPAFQRKVLAKILAKGKISRTEKHILKNTDPEIFKHEDLLKQYLTSASFDDPEVEKILREKIIQIKNIPSMREDLARFFITHASELRDQNQSRYLDFFNMYSQMPNDELANKLLARHMAKILPKLTEENHSRFKEIYEHQGRAHKATTIVEGFLKPRELNALSSKFIMDEIAKGTIPMEGKFVHALLPSMKSRFDFSLYTEDELTDLHKKLEASIQEKNGVQFDRRLAEIKEFFQSPMCTPRNIREAMTGL